MNDPLGIDDMIFKNADKIVYPLSGDQEIAVHWMNRLCKQLNEIGFQFIPIPLQAEDQVINHCVIACYPPLHKARRNTMAKETLETVNPKTPKQLMVGLNLEENIVLISCGRGGWEREYSLADPRCEGLVKIYLLAIKQLMDLTKSMPEDTLENNDPAILFHPSYGDP